MGKELQNVELVKKLQDKQLYILKELDRVCKKLDITYCMAFGSCLGAIRHKGFIPWDDDIDVYMKIDDLEILQNNAELFDKGFFLQHYKSDQKFGLMITRLRDSNTTLIEKSEVNRDINHGIFIDIYPLFNSPPKGLMAKWLVFVSMVLRLMLYNDIPQNRGVVMKVGSAIMLKIIPAELKKQIINKCYNIIKDSPRTGYISSLYGDEANIRYKEEWFFPVQWLPFEDMMVPVEADSDKYLKCTYGDYMTLPPENKRVFHHEYACVDFEKPYIYYKGKEYCKGQ